MNPGKIAFALATLVLCAAVPIAARAESEAEKKQQAKEHYEMATRFYDVGKYGEAIAEYEQAYLLVEDAALLFNIGQAYRLWDRPEDAMRAYKNFLRRRPDAGNRADGERKIADLEKLVEDRRRGLPGQPTPAPVQLAQPISPPASGLAPRAEGPAPVPGAPAPLGSAAAPIPEPPPGVAFEQPRQAEPASPKKKWIAYSLLGVGGACLVTTVIAAAVGASKAKILQDASQNRQPPFDPAVESSGKKANAVAGVAAVVGIASAGVGGYLLWKWRGTAAPSVSVAPVAAPTFAGGSALLTF